MNTPNCEKCGLYLSCNKPKMKPSGEGKIKLLVVGEAPGREEDMVGRQFVGESGRLLRETFEHLGVGGNDMRFTNAVNCRPPGNKTPSDAQIKYCRPIVEAEIERFKPKVILCLGLPAVKSVVGRVYKKDFGTMRQWRGIAIPDRTLNAWIVPTYHPSYLLRENNPALSKIFFYDIALAISKLNEPLPKLPEIDLRLRTKSKDVELEIRQLLYHSVEIDTVAFDYETNMLKPYSPLAKVVTASFAYYYDGKIRAVSFPMFDDIIDWWKLFLETDFRKAAANMKFEYIWSVKKFGVAPKNLVYDSLLISHVEDNTRVGKGSGLKALVYKKLGVPPYDEDVSSLISSDHPETPNKIDQIPIMDLLKYNALDSAYELILIGRRYETSES